MSDFENLHPCQKCGACCAIFRVGFLRSEISVWQVPTTAIAETGGDIVNLKGTDKTHRPACTSLKGKVGQKVECSIYQNRPSPCRNFKASYEDGYHQERCDSARRAHGLKPLTKIDWKNYRTYLPLLG